jgi:hypothetical protein
MTGISAAKELIAAARREEVVSSDLVARALGQPKRRLLRDWRKRNQPETRVGREIMLASTLVLSIYFPHLPATGDHSTPVEPPAA